MNRIFTTHSNIRPCITGAQVAAAHAAVSPAAGQESGIGQEAFLEKSPWQT
ncbi:hypothetical protein BH11PSE8_BH11PSE8_07540 [soil metagenome]